MLSEPEAEARYRQRALPAGEEQLLSVLDPFQTAEGSRGPHLQSPRPRLRIVPGKPGRLAPCRAHAVGVPGAGRACRKWTGRGKIYGLYPDVDPPAIDDALDLERQLARNLRPLIAA